MEYKNRLEVPEEYKCDLSGRYKSFKEWKESYNLIKDKIINLDKYKGTLLESSEKLLESLDYKFEIEQEVIRLYCYSMLIIDQQLEDSEAIKHYSLAEQLFSDFVSKTSYFEPEILSDIDKVKKLLENNDLNKYKSYLEDIIRFKNHILSSDEESIISKLSATANNLDNMNNTMLNSELNYGEILVDGKNIEITSNNINKFLKSKDRNIREDVYLKVNKSRAQFKTTFANQFISAMKIKNEIAKLKKYSGVQEMVFFNQDIPVAVNQILYEVVDSNVSVFQKYLNLLTKALDVEKLQYYDLRVNPFKLNKIYEVNDIKKIILESLSILGSEYNNVLKKAFDEKWIDYYGYKGKTASIYCMTNYGDIPTIQAHINGDLEDVSTLAHELGHAVNAYFMNNNNLYHESEHDYIRAEITSLTNEILLTEHIIRTSTDVEEKKSYIYRMLDTIQNNLFSACQEGLLENKVYDKLAKDEVVTSDTLFTIIEESKKKYYGECVKENEYSSNSWISRAHYFSPFYLYQYAVAITCACFVANKILNNEDDMLNKYLEYLKLGNQNNCVDTVKMLGINLLDKDVYKNAIKYFESLTDKLDELIEK